LSGSRPTEGAQEPRDAALLRLLVDHIPAAIITTDLTGVIQFCNRAAEGLYGRPRAELIGKPGTAYSIDPVDASLQSEISTALATHRTWVGDFRLARADGTVVTVRSIDAGIFDATGKLVGVACVTVDVTQQHQLEEALRSSEARKSAVLAAALDAIVSVDAAGRIVEFNPAAEEMFGYKRDEVLGHFMADLLIPSTLRAAHQRGFEAHLRGKDSSILGRRIEVRGLHKDGQEFPVELAIVRIDWSGPALFTAFIRDITERRLAEQALVESRERFADLASTLQRSLLPPTLPVVPGVDVAALYHPAGEGFEVGGDFYDLFETGKDDWHLVLGDVEGKGPEAATVTALARYTLRAAAIRNRKPAVILSMLNQAIIRDGSNRYCTVSYARMRPRGNGHMRLSAASGGHPLPLRVRLDGTVEPVGVHGPLLGLLDEVRLTEVRVDIGPSELVVFYTDGITEARRGGEEFGDDRFAKLLESLCGAAPHAVVNAVGEAVLEFQGGQAADDFCIVAVRPLPQGPAIS
jgi:sigma-B regulation protein RsbU (phosphoserine phosphatase)